MPNYSRGQQGQRLLLDKPGADRSQAVLIPAGAETLAPRPSKA